MSSQFTVGPRAGGPSQSGPTGPTGPTDGYKGERHDSPFRPPHSWTSRTSRRGIPARETSPSHGQPNQQTTSERTLS